MLIKKFAGFLVLLFTLTIIGCSENPTIVNDQQWQTPSSIESPCGKQYFDLYIDQTTLAGTVRVANDLDNIYITYNLDDPYLAEPGEMHVWLGPTAPTKRGAPGQYPFHSDNSNYVSTYSFTLAKADIEQYLSGETFYFMTHISVIKILDDGSYSSASTGYSVKIEKPKKGAWYGFSSYTWSGCGYD